MVNSSPQPFASAKTETEVAVLQVQFQNLNTKVDDLKTDIKDISDTMSQQSESAMTAIKQLRDENASQHKDVADKITSLEKWKWMMMGAGSIAGAVGWPAISKLLGI